MKFKEFIGIDISKLTFDVCIYSSKESNNFENTAKGFQQFIKWIRKHVSLEDSKLHFSLEHTGIYSLPISQFFSENNLSFTLIPGLAIKRSMGIQRGKDDQIDAYRIATYSYQRRDSIKESKLPSKQLLKLRRLISMRDRLVKQRKGYLKDQGEHKRFLDKKENKILFRVVKGSIRDINKHLTEVEKEMLEIVKADQTMFEQYNLITSIKGVGLHTAILLIAYTDSFTKFKTWRQFASYAGTAPFPYRSGTSINGRSRVSHLANKKIKSNLNMCARSAIVYNPELRMYYKKRKQQGDNGMCVLNIIRNKLLSRIFAVVKRGTPYVDTVKYAA